MNKLTYLGLAIGHQKCKSIFSLSIVHLSPDVKFITLANLVTTVGCDCDDTLPNADDFCPRDEECVQCKCLPKG